MSRGRREFQFYAPRCGELLANGKPCQRAVIGGGACRLHGGGGDREPNVCEFDPLPSRVCTCIGGPMVLGAVDPDTPTRCLRCGRCA